MQTTKIQHLVLDSAPIINGSFDRSVAQHFYTVQEVLDEITDKKSQDFLANLHLDMQILSSSADSLREIIDFARETGDISSLSLTDIKVMALTLDLTKAHCQSAIIRATPQAIESEIPTSAQQLIEKSSASEDDEEEGWITAETLRKNSFLGQNSKFPLVVACACNDFAMQNTMIHKGLSVVNASGVAINELKRFILRCHACGEIVKEMTRQFCPVCGRDCLKKISYCIDAETGKMQIFLKANYQHNIRGTKYSIPNPLKEKLIFTEDQKEYQMSLRKLKKQTKSVFDPDYVFGEDEEKPKNFNVKIGYGKRNVNQVRR